jgi:hypothetical protein
MNARKNRRIAWGLIVGPILIAAVMHFFGSDPVVFRMEGPLLHPHGASFNIQNFGVVLVLAILIGLLWLIGSLVGQLFIKRSRDEKEA